MGTPDPWRFPQGKNVHFHIKLVENVEKLGTIVKEAESSMRSAQPEQILNMIKNKIKTNYNNLYDNYDANKNAIKKTIQQT